MRLDAVKEEVCGLAEKPTSLEITPGQSGTDKMEPTEAEGRKSNSFPNEENWNNKTLLKALMPELLISIGELGRRSRRFFSLDFDDCLRRGSTVSYEIKFSFSHLLKI